MLTIIFCWLVLFAVIFLVGKFFVSFGVFGLKNIVNTIEWYEYFWIGTFLVFGILQIWSFFLPVNYLALVLISIISIVSLAILRKQIKIPKVSIFLIGLISAILFVISYYASQPVGWDDTLLYHLNAVKWGNLYSVVPGLANLHSRLGFNSSFFLFASMLDSWFMTARSSHLALSILAAVLSVEYLWIFVRSKEKNLKLFCLFTTPIIFFSIAKQEVIASLSPDFALLLIALATTIEFLKKDRVSIITAIFLSILLISVKFSAVSFSVMILIIIFIQNRGLWKWIVVSALFLIIPFLLRNIYLTGWLFYPLPIFGFNVDWVVPREQVKLLYTVIQTWARVPGIEWSKYVNASFWEWFPSWYIRNQQTIELKIFAFAASLVFISPFLKMINKNIIKQNLKMICVILISFISTIYIFVTAPDIRFGAVFVWIFLASVLSLFFSLIKWNLNLKILTICISVLLIFLTSWPIRLENEPILKSVRWESSWQTKKVNGILMPVEQNLCGNSDLPCSPEENKIQERVPGDISKGYKPIN